MNAINNYFQHIFVINLDRRRDRWFDVSQELDIHNIKAEKISAVDGKKLEPIKKCSLLPGEIGASMSHSSVLKKMISEKWERILVLEDDIQFSVNVKEFWNQNQQYIPEQWDMLYLGGNHMRPPVAINPVISRCTKTFAASSYGITLEHAKNIVWAIDELRVPVDVIYSSYHVSTNCFAFTPSICCQKPGNSDIQEKHVDYSEKFMTSGRKIIGKQFK